MFPEVDGSGVVVVDVVTCSLVTLLVLLFGNNDDTDTTISWVVVGET